MSMTNVLKDLEMVEQASASNTTEPFAAHELLPLVSALAKEVVRIEGGLVQVASAKPELHPQMTQLSVQLVTELRPFLRELALEGMLLAMQGEEEDEQHLRARGLFLALESQIERKPMEMVADFWMQQMQAQAQQMIAEMEAEAEEDEEEYEQDEDEDVEDESTAAAFHLMNQAPVTPSELPQPPLPPETIQHAAPQPALETLIVSPESGAESDDNKTSSE